MSKKTIKNIFEEKINRDEIYNYVLCQTLENKTKKITKFMWVPICVACFVFMLFAFHQQTYQNVSFNVYAYTDQSMKKQKIEDNIKFQLTKYNQAMSSVPGFPIYFEKDSNIDYLDIEILHGEIMKWDQDTGVVDKLGNCYKLFENKTLYFEVKNNTEIIIRGKKKDKEIIKKSIIVSSKDYQYYGELK